MALFYPSAVRPGQLFRVTPPAAVIQRASTTLFRCYRQCERLTPERTTTCFLVWGGGTKRCPLARLRFVVGNRRLVAATIIHVFVSDYRRNNVRSTRLRKGCTLRATTQPFDECPVAWNPGHDLQRLSRLEFIRCLGIFFATATAVLLSRAMQMSPCCACVPAC